ncbi:MAG: helix-turn-helix transcriptional regulator [Pseudomonadota bacterium]
MATSTRIVATLKKALKTRAITYRDLARRLELSESAVKHMFSTGNFSLKRLDALCDVLEMDFSDLVALSEAQEPRLERLPAEFEEEIVSDVRLLLITYCLINYWTFDEIIERYAIERAEGFRYLRRLDQMKIVEVLPGDRVRLLIANNFAWRKNGAMERYFNQRVQKDFFRHDFTVDGSLRIAKNGMLSRRAQRQLHDKLKSIGELFDEATWEERKIPAEDRHGTTMVLAIRQWIFEGFRDLERDPK